MVVMKTPAEIERMRAAGRVVAEALRVVGTAARPGPHLTDLDALAAEVIRAAGATSSFLHYHPHWARSAYPAVLCLSVNDVIVHGIPDDRVLRSGDVLSIDCGAELDGFHGDAAVTVQVGDADPAAQRLITAARLALLAGMDAAVVDGRLGDISHAVEEVGRAAGYGIPAGFGGHGVGTAMHEDPPVPNVGRAGRGLLLRPGLVLAIEPMLIEGGRDRHRLLADGWSVASADGSRAAHWEHTVAVTPKGPVVLTAP